MDITAAVFQTATPSLRRLTIAAAGPREVRVRMVATGICHTDLKAAGPDGPVPRPVDAPDLAEAHARLLAALSLAAGEM